MKIPFIEHIGIGLHITDYAIRWVKLSRIRSRITIEEAERIEIRENQTIGKALVELVENIHPDFEHITVNIDAAPITRLVVDMPEFDDEAEMDLWLAEAKKEAIPEGYDAEDVVVSYHIFGDPEIGQKCLLLTASKKAVQERIELLKSVGLKPLILTCGDLESRYAVMFDEDLNHLDTLYLSVFEDQASLQQLKNGLLDHYYPFEDEVQLAEDFIGEVESLVASRASHGAESGSQLFTSISRQFQNTDAQSGILELNELGPLSHLRYKESCLDSDYTIACGMAVKQLYPDIDGINFLEAGQRFEAKEQIQQKDALHLGAALGSALFLLWLLLFAVQAYLDYRISEVDETVARVQDKATLVSEARDRVLELEKQVIGARELIGRRTNASLIIGETGKAFPKGTWLTELVIENQSESGKIFDVRLNGYAENEALITVLLEKLESKKYRKQLRLVYSGQVNFRDVYETSRYKNRPVVYFEIRMQHVIKQE